MRTTNAIFVLAAMLALAAHAWAGDVQFQQPNREVYAGIPFRMLVRVTDAKDVSAPVAPEIPGATVAVSEGGRQSMTSIVNGRVTNSTSVDYVVEITPEKAGPLVVPAVSITVDGKESRSRPFNVDVRSTADAGDLLSIEVVGEPSRPYVGQPLELTLRIAIKPFQDRAIGQLNEQQMWSLVDVKNSQWGPFGDELAALLQRGKLPRTRQEQRAGGTVFVYEVTRTIWPPKAGPAEIGDVRIRMTYPLGIRVVQNVFFERELALTDSRPLVVPASAKDIVVQAPPEQGRPAGYAGAMGDFVMEVSALPTTVAVGDPVTLTIAITDRTVGGSNMDTLQPPALAGEQALTKDFRVPNEALSGTVSGRTKRFTVTVRPLRAGQLAIPAIAFPFFDPKAGAYRITTSKPITITATPASQMDLSKIVNANGGAGTGAGQPAVPATQLTEVEGGLMANRPLGPDILANERGEFAAPAAAALVLPPACAAAALAWSLHRRRHAADAGLARRSRARRTADRRLAQAADAAGVAGAVTGFVEDAIGRAPGTLTRGDLAAVLEANRVPDDVRSTVTDLLSRCDRARYAPNAAGAGTEDLRTAAAAAIATLDLLGLRRQKGGMS
jgi:hypothetical protein